MKAVTRNYSGNGAKELIDLIEANAAEVEGILRGVDGFIGYTCARTENGGFTLTVCRDQAGIDESVRLAKKWVAENAAATGVGAPAIAVGDVVIHL